jgi:thiamine pyrophosphokinase
MSSHHIIREGQEPALLITAFHPTDSELIGQLLEWSPTVIITETAAQACANAAIKVDKLVSTLEKKSALETLFACQVPLQIYVTEKETMIEKAIELGAANHATVSIVGRLPEISALNRLKNSFPATEIVFYHQNKKTTYTYGQTFGKWVTKNTVFEVISQVKFVEIINLERKQCIFVAVTDGNCKIVADNNFWITEL